MPVEEFLAISERDPRRMELIDGEIFVVSEPRLAHGVLQAMLIGALAQWHRRAPGRGSVAGPTGVHLGSSEARGVPELWLVDIVGVVLVFRRSGPGVGYYDSALELDVTDTLASPLLPGFELALSELFSEPRT